MGEFVCFSCIYAVSIGAEYIVRGIRNVKDAEYELKMADFNWNYRGVRTLFVPARAEIAEVSSTAVRDIGKYGGDLSKYVNEKIIDTVSKRLKG